MAGFGSISKLKLQCSARFGSAVSAVANPTIHFVFLACLADSDPIFEATITLSLL